MNSGIRFSVALIVVIVVLLGFYYAGLDDGVDGGEGAPGSVVTEPATSPAEASTEADEESVVLPMPLAEDFPEIPEPEPGAVDLVGLEAPSINDTSAESGSATDDDTPVDEAFARAGDPASTNTDSSEPTIDLAAEEVMSVSEDLTDAEIPDLAPVDEASLDSEMADVLETGPEIIDPEMATDVDATPSASSGEETIPTDPVEATESVVTIEPRDGSGFGRSAARPGVGIHRIATVAQDGGLAQESLAALAAAEAMGVIPGPRNTAWVPVPAGTERSLLADAIVGEGPDDVEHVLVLTDAANSLDLAGRVAEAEVRGGGGSDRWTVRFDVDPDDRESVLIATRPLIGHAVVWVDSGRSLVIARPSIAINRQGAAPTIFNSRAAADAVAESLRTGGVTPPESPAVPPTVAVESKGDTAETAVDFVDYEVRQGDSFEKIATEWFGDPKKWSLIAEANPDAESNKLQPGQILRLPPADTSLAEATPRTDTATGTRTYRTRSGDTLGGIAQSVYGKASEWPRIYEANKATIGDDPGRLKPDLELVIP